MRGLTTDGVMGSSLMIALIILLRFGMLLRNRFDKVDGAELPREELLYKAARTTQYLQIFTQMMIVIVLAAYSAIIWMCMVSTVNNSDPAGFKIISNIFISIAGFLTILNYYASSFFNRFDDHDNTFKTGTVTFGCNNWPLGKHSTIQVTRICCSTIITMIGSIHIVGEAYPLALSLFIFGLAQMYYYYPEEKEAIRALANAYPEIKI